MVAFTFATGKIETSNTLTLRNDPHGKLDLSQQITIESHRSGWHFALQAIRNFHNTEGTKFDGFLERTFGWHLEQCVNRGMLPYNQPWVGVMHNPPEMPGFWNHAASPEGILQNYFFRESLKSCKGIFVLSDYLARWLGPRVDVPVVSVKHPTDLNVPSFSLEAFHDAGSQRIVQCGFWLRKFQSLKHLPLPELQKICIIPHEYAREYRDLERKFVDLYDDTGEECIGDYSEWQWMPVRDYDQLLQSSIVFLDLYDASANNVVLECIARNTPLLVNPLPAVIEYLGPDYPLYFDDLQDAADKARSTCVADAHHYLSEMDKSRFTADQFKRSIEQSTIYRSLPSAKDGHILAAEMRPLVDTLDQLNIIKGKPLSNRFVFVVCFRNIDWKLDRCLRSILRQNQQYDYGIILIDDASEDFDEKGTLSLLDEGEVPYVLVRNQQQKYFTRNLYNAVNLLVDDPESIILEVDGDDYLEDTDVLGVLSEPYELGAVKTFGSFRCVPEGLAQAESVSAFRNVPSINDMSNPWDLDACVAWVHLKSYKKSLFMKVPLVYFWERTGGNWLRMAEDLTIHPKMVELARYRTAYVEDILYVYDVSGEKHDALEKDRADYLLNKLYKRPYGSFMRQCQRQLGKERNNREGAPEVLAKTNNTLWESKS